MRRLDPGRGTRRPSTPAVNPATPAFGGRRSRPRRAARCASWWSARICAKAKSRSHGRGAPRRSWQPPSAAVRLSASPPSYVGHRRQLAHRAVRNGETVACRPISVASKGHQATPARPDSPGAWKATQEWSRNTESFFSAWIERMFDAPADANLGFPSLAPVLHDPARNFLWGYLGLREDDPKNRDIPRAVPDCADLPYYLRAYFAWKLGLPFALRDCDRGKSDRPPKCGPILHNEQADENIRGRARSNASAASCAAWPTGFIRAARAPPLTTRKPISIPWRSRARPCGREPSTPTPTATCS